jgi:hypothetical protein
MMTSLSEAEVLGKTLVSLVITLLLFAWITVALRIWVRFKITRSPGWDDAAIVLALVLFTCYCTLILVIVVRARENRKLVADLAVSLPPTVSHISTDQFQFVQLSEVFYILTTTLLKISLGLFFLRLVTKLWQRYLFNALIAMAAIYGFFYFCVSIARCRDPANMSGSKQCASAGLKLTTGYLYGVINIISDWIFTLIPIALLVESNMDRKSKFSVGIVMGFAAVGSISSIIRLVFLRGLLFGSGGVSSTLKYRCLHIHTYHAFSRDNQSHHLGT